MLVCIGMGMLVCHWRVHILQRDMPIAHTFMAFNYVSYCNAMQYSEGVHACTVHGYNYMHYRTEIR